MPLSTRRLVFWTTVFATIGTWLALPYTPPSRLPPVEPAPWIPLPASGMDASQASIRQLLSTSLADVDDFAWRCGHRDDGVPERYLLTEIRDPPQPANSVEFVPAGASVAVVMRTGIPVEHAIEAAPARADFDAAQQAAFSRRSLARRAVEPIRLLWDTQTLWHAEQTTFGCSHGGLLILQACVRGRYAIRVRDCGPEITPARAALWDAVTALLPELASPEDAIP